MKYKASTYSAKGSSINLMIQLMNRLYLAGLLGVCLSVSGISRASELLDFGLGDTDIPIVLSASRLRHPLTESPASISVIDRELIENSGARSIVDLLRLVPGFQVGRLVNGNSVATYHGLAERYNPRLQLLIDGRPTYVPVYGGIPWSELPLNIRDIERIEVIRSANAATFGPNSFYAVISVTTKSAVVGAGWTVDGEIGGNEYRRLSLQHNGELNRNPYRFSLQVDTDQGFENIPDEEKANTATFNLRRQLNADDSFVFATGIADAGHIELDSVVEPNDLAQYEETTNAYLQLVWERATSVDDSLRVQYYYNYFDIDDQEVLFFDLGEVADNPAFTGIDLSVDLNRSTRSTRHEIEVQRTQRRSTDHRIVYGAAIRRDTVRGQFIFNDDRARDIDTGRIFAQSEKALGKNFLLSTGLMLEENSNSGFTASPRGSLIYRKSDENHFRFSYSRAARTPLILEEDGVVQFEYSLSTGDTLINSFIHDNNTVIKPEYIDVFDLGLFHIQPEKRFSLDSKFSYQRISDRIRTRTDQAYAPDTFDGESKFYTNGSTYSVKTLEFDLDYKPTDTRRFKLGYSYAFDLKTPGTGQKLTPRHTLSLYASQALSNGMILSSEYYYTSEWVWDDVRDLSNLNRLDIRLQKNWNVRGFDTSLAVQAELELGKNVDYLERNEVNDMYFVALKIDLP